MVLTKSDYGFKMLDAGRALKYAASCMERRYWIGLFIGIREKKIRTDFNIPEDLDIVVIIGFGYPSRKLTGMPEKNNKID